MRKAPLRIAILTAVLCGALTISSCGCYAGGRTTAGWPLLSSAPVSGKGMVETDLAGDWYAPAEALYLHMTENGTAALISTGEGDGGFLRGQWYLTEKYLTVFIEERDPGGAYTLLTGELERVSAHMFLWRYDDAESVFVQVDWYLSEAEKQ
jgi:hypothetical protein